MELSFPRRNQKNSMHSMATLNRFTSANSIEATFTMIIPFPVRPLNFLLYDYMLRLRSSLLVCKSQSIHDSQIITCF